MLLKKYKRLMNSGVTCLNSFKCANDKYIFTGIICLIQVSYGYSCSSFGPSFVDLKHIFNTSMNEISLVTSFMSFGYMTGSLFGLFFKHMNKRISLVSSLFLMAITIITIPYSSHLLQLYMCFWLFGFGSGLYVNVKYVWLIEMWQTNSAPILHLAGFMFGIGHTVGPLLEKPYLSGEKIIGLTSNLTEVQTSLAIINDRSLRRSKLLVPYLICGVFQLIGPILMTIMFMRTKTKIGDNNNRIKETSEGETIERPKQRKKLFETMKSQKHFMIGLVSLFLAFFAASESIFFAFSATYFQYIPLKLSASRAAELVSVMALTFTISRGLAVLIAIRTKPQNIIAIFLTILLISMVILFFAANSLTLLWFGIMTMSFGFSPIYASIFAFMGRYLEFTNQIGTILMLSANGLNLILPPLVGKYIEVIPNIFLLTLIVLLMFSTILFLITIYFVRKFHKLLTNVEEFKIVEHEKI